MPLKNVIGWLQRVDGVIAPAIISIQKTRDSIEK
jgi:hypothetical protein